MRNTAMLRGAVEFSLLLTMDTDLCFRVPRAMSRSTDVPYSGGLLHKIPKAASRTCSVRGVYWRTVGTFSSAAVAPLTAVGKFQQTPDDRTFDVSEVLEAWPVHRRRSAL